MRKLKKEANEIKDLGQLVTAIKAANTYFLTQVQKQVNTALTLRNWIIGQYVVEYEQKGEDRAQYGQKVLKEISRTLKKGGLKSFGERNLYLCKDFTSPIRKFCRRCPQNPLPNAALQFYSSGRPNALCGSLNAFINLSAMRDHWISVPINSIGVKMMSS